MWKLSLISEQISQTMMVTGEVECEGSSLLIPSRATILLEMLKVKVGHKTFTVANTTAIPYDVDHKVPLPNNNNQPLLISP